MIPYIVHFCTLRAAEVSFITELIHCEAGFFGYMGGVGGLQLSLVVFFCFCLLLFPQSVTSMYLNSLYVEGDELQSVLLLIMSTSS